MSNPNRNNRSPIRVTAFLLVVALTHAGCTSGKVRQGETRSPRVREPADLGSMIQVPAGPFTMGRNEGADDEKPERRVWLDEFYIDRLEVTNAQFKTFCDDRRFLYPDNPIYDLEYFKGKPEYPVVNITYSQARAYCEWVGKRLPTEAEWEKTARGSDGQPYAWGHEWLEDRANLTNEPYRYTAPVGSFPAGASPYGALDMAGNVWEWCADWYETSYYAVAPDSNPPGPIGPSKERAVRGGGFSSGPADAEMANRSKNDPTLPIYHLGCRCAWSERPPATARP